MIVRVEIPGIDGVEGSQPEKLRLDRAQAHGLAVQLEEQGFGYGAFWCQVPTIRDALWILWSAIRRKEVRTAKTPSIAEHGMRPWDHPNDSYDPWTGEPPADQEQPPPPPPPPPKKTS